MTATEQSSCEMTNPLFLMLGSLFSFYLPMVIMVTTYVLTIPHLTKQKMCTVKGARHVVASDAANRWRQTVVGIRNHHHQQLGRVSTFSEGQALRATSAANSFRDGGGVPRSNTSLGNGARIGLWGSGSANGGGGRSSTGSSFTTSSSIAGTEVSHRCCR